MQKVRKVMTKFPATELRSLCNDYMKLYQQLHATERPQDISDINVLYWTFSFINNYQIKVKKKPFVNTTDLKAERPDMIYHMKKRRNNLKKDDQNADKPDDDKDSTFLS